MVVSGGVQMQLTGEGVGQVLYSSDINIHKYILCASHYHSGGGGSENKK